MVLAMLESAVSMSAYAIEFMAVNCIELKKPWARPSATMSASDVPEPTNANRLMVTPIINVLTISTWR